MLFPFLQATEERNYHVFYELLSGLSEQDKEKYGLQTADKYFYLNQVGKCCTELLFSVTLACNTILVGGMLKHCRTLLSGFGLCKTARE